MKRKEFLEKLEKNKGKDLVIEVEDEIIQKATMEKMKYEVKEDKLNIQSSINLDFAVINLNIIRDIQEISENITLFLENKKETKIKILCKNSSHI